MRFRRAVLWLAVVGVMVLLGALFAAPAMAAPAQQIQFHTTVDGISAVELAWWFQHIGDKNGAFWKPLAPTINDDIYWVVDPREDSHQVIGSLFESDQTISGGIFEDNKLHMQIQYMDYITQPRAWVPNQPQALTPALGFPADYAAPYESPQNYGGYTVNGFNQNMLFFDGKGFCPGRILWSWVNTGNDDTAGKVGPPYSIDLYCTFYLHYMEGNNLPPAMSAAGYYYSGAQVSAMWGVWEQMLNSLPDCLPEWFGTETQDDLARASTNGSANGWTVTSVIDTGVLVGANSKMEVWWWMHGMGDEPGNGYVYWDPRAHHTIRWLPGYSPADVVLELEGKKNVPQNRVVPGIIYPDLQGSNLVQAGGGMMAYPVDMAPVPGIYETLDPMMVVSQAQVDAWEAGTGPRFPQPARWLLHQWGDVPGGLVHRSTVMAPLPLGSPVTQAGFYSEHQLEEGLFKGLGYLPTLYHDWVKQHNK